MRPPQALGPGVKQESVSTLRVIPAGQASAGAAGAGQGGTAASAIGRDLGSVPSHHQQQQQHRQRQAADAAALPAKHSMPDADAAGAMDVDGSIAAPPVHAAGRPGVPQPQTSAAVADPADVLEAATQRVPTQERGCEQQQRQQQEQQETADAQMQDAQAAPAAADAAAAAEAAASDGEEHAPVSMEWDEEERRRPCAYLDADFCQAAGLTKELYQWQVRLGSWAEARDAGQKVLPCAACRQAVLEDG